MKNVLFIILIVICVACACKTNQQAEQITIAETVTKPVLNATINDFDLAPINSADSIFWMKDSISIVFDAMQINSDILDSLKTEGLSDSILKNNVTSGLKTLNNDTVKVGIKSKSKGYPKSNIKPQTSNKDPKNDYKKSGYKAERLLFKGRSYDVVILNPTMLNIVMCWKNDSTNFPLGTLSAAASKYPNSCMATNAGMYHANLKPVGLYIEKSKILNPLDTISSNKQGYNFYLQPNGVFYVPKNGTPSICKTLDFSRLKEVEYATQSGPMLVIDKTINELFNKDSKNTNIRSGIGVNDSTLVFVISNQLVNFHEFASVFKDKYHCQNALYLDGAISDAIIPALGRKTEEISYGAMVVVIPKNKHKR